MDEGQGNTRAMRTEEEEENHRGCEEVGRDDAEGGSGKGRGGGR